MTAYRHDGQPHAGGTLAGVMDDGMLWGDITLPTRASTQGIRARTGAVALPTDHGTVARFLAKCAPLGDDGHRWWLGAIDGGADRSGGYGRFQAGFTPDAVVTPAHRYALTLEHGPIPTGLVSRHRCDELLCTAPGHLELGTSADNNWDAAARPFRAACLDTRGSSGRSRAIRQAVLDVLATGVVTPAAIGVAARAAMAEGDPDRDQLTSWPRGGY